MTKRWKAELTTPWDSGHSCARKSAMLSLSAVVCLHMVGGLTLLFDCATMNTSVEICGTQLRVRDLFVPTRAVLEEA